MCQKQTLLEIMLRSGKTQLYIIGLEINWFKSLKYARCKIEAWRILYTQRRPHPEQDWMTLSEFAEKPAAGYAANMWPVVPDYD